jgi:hypothetical protein
VSSTGTSPTVPATVRTAFALYMAAVVVSLVNLLAQVHFGISRPAGLVNPALELALFLGIGLPMRAGRPWAQIGMFSIALLLILLNLFLGYGLTRAFGSLPTYQVVLLLVLVGGKVALLGAATWMMYRPQNQAYFG